MTETLRVLYHYGIVCVCCFGLSQIHKDLRRQLGLKGSKMIRLVSIAEFIQDQLEGWSESRGLYADHTSWVFAWDWRV